MCYLRYNSQRSIHEPLCQKHFSVNNTCLYLLHNYTLTPNAKSSHIQYIKGTYMVQSHRLPSKVRLLCLFSFWFLCGGGRSLTPITTASTLRLASAWSAVFPPPLCGYRSTMIVHGSKMIVMSTNSLFMNGVVVLRTILPAVGGSKTARFQNKEFVLLRIIVELVVQVKMVDGCCQGLCMSILGGRSTQCLLFALAATMTPPAASG